MIINELRQAVQSEYDTLMESNDPPDKEELEKCARGLLMDFHDNYYDYDEYCFDGWITRAHRDFYRACERLKRAEAEEYKRVMELV